MTGTGYSGKLDAAGDYSDLFAAVKEGVEEVLGARRAGMMLGISNLGAGPRGFVGAYHPVDTNIIVLNSAPIELVRRKDPALEKPFVFHLLLHEYLHSLGIYDEAQTRQTAYKVCREMLGERHPATRLSVDASAAMPNLRYQLDGDPEGSIRIIRGFDKESLRPYA